jgi:hypothetical protein
MPAGILILRHDLDERPQVQRVAELLDCEVDLVIGKLWRLWRHADLHSDDGLFHDASDESLDRAVACTGFCQALRQVGWLELRVDGVAIPKWDEWCSAAAIKRLLGDVNAPRDQPGFLQFWAAYPKKQAKVDARKAWNQIRPTAALLATILSSVEEWKSSKQWREGIIPHPATWLRGKRWEDEDVGGHGQGVGPGGRILPPEGKYRNLSG